MTFCSFEKPQRSSAAWPCSWMSLDAPRFGNLEDTLEEMIGRFAARLSRAVRDGKAGAGRWRVSGGCVGHFRREYPPLGDGSKRNDWRLLTSLSSVARARDSAVFRGLKLQPND